MLLTRQITLGAALVALIVGVIGIAYAFPVGGFFMYTLASVVIAFALIKGGAKTAVMTYLASSVLLTLVYGVIYSIPFFAFFGIYPVCKGFIEQKMHRWMARAVKTLYFFLMIGVIWCFFEESINAIHQRMIGLLEQAGLSLPLAPGIFLLLMLIGGWAYDGILSSLIFSFGRRMKSAYQVNGAFYHTEKNHHEKKGE